jgi:Ca-activated chloride channel family protein
VGFERPLLLLLLPLAGLPLLLQRRRRPLPLVALQPAAREGAPSLRVRLLWLPAALWAAAVAGTLLAAAGPHGGLLSRPDRRYARDIVLAIDASESMRGMDFELDGRPVSRMDAAIRFSREFIDRREGDRVGLVAFGSRALTQCPLTFDRAIARTLLGHVRAETAGKRTALGEGIALGVARLRTRGGALVLLSDGQNTAGGVGPDEAASAAAARGVRVYAVGVGSDGPVPIPARMPSGRTRVEMKDYRLDEAALRGVAERTGGRYFRADDAAALEGVFAEIDRLEKKPAEATRSMPAERYADLPALAGALSLALLVVLSASALRTAPRLR